MNTVQKLQGMKDILPIEHEYFTFIKKVVRHHARQAGMRRITPPLMEFTKTFRQSIGEETDIVSKELYSFTDLEGQSVTLRPELTAGIARAYIEHDMSSWPQPVEFYSIEPVFRYDTNEEEGYYRGFHLFNFEIFGEEDPLLDAQLIQMCMRIYEQLGIGDIITLHINTIGGGEDREAYIDELKNYYTTKERSLCETCKHRLEMNPMRILDCQEEDCSIIANLAPKMVDFLDEENKKHYEKVKEYLDIMEVPYIENHKIVRGFDYYNRTVFEFHHDEEDGRFRSIGGGGRYDGLVSHLGGPQTPAVGFASGMERVTELMIAQGIKPPSKDRAHVFIIQIGEDAKREALKLSMQLRAQGVKTMGALGNQSIKSQLEQAQRFDVDYALVLGQVEVRERKIIIRDMNDGTQQTVPLAEALDKVIERVGEDRLDTHDFTRMIKHVPSSSN